MSEHWQEAPGGRENALLHSLGELSLSSLSALADERCCSRNQSQQQALSPCCARAERLHEEKESLPQNTDPKILCLRAQHPSSLLWDRGTWQPQLRFARHRAEGWC